MESKQSRRAVLPGLDRAYRLTGDSDQVCQFALSKFFSARATRKRLFSRSPATLFTSLHIHYPEPLMNVK